MRQCFVLTFVAALPAIACAQDSDTAIFETHAKFTLLSQIQNPDERRDFKAAFNAKDPGARHGLAERFIQSYPQSWLLSQAYDIAARSSVDLGEYDRALREGRFSLRLLPENETLLVLMANLEARKQHFANAKTDAEDALEYLDEFARPGNMSETEWSGKQVQLKASAYFALGRAYAAEGLAQNTASDSLARAMQALDRGAAWNPNDPEIAYLRGIVGVRLGHSAKAGGDLAFAAKHSDQLRAKALDALRLIYRGAHPENVSFDRLLASQKRREIDKSLREENADWKTSEAIRGGYAGPEPCKPCHPSEYANWHKTGMAKMFRAYDAENVIGDFSSRSEFKDGSGEPVVRMGIDSRPYFEIRDASGGWRKFHVDYTIGSKWQQAYATKAADGRWHVIPIQYNLLKRSWVNYWEIIDSPGSKRARIPEFPKLLAITNYQENCAICHTSQLTAEIGSDAPTQHAVFKQPGVDCEMCHGPSAWHVKERLSGRPSDTRATEPPVDFRRLNNRDGVRVCAQCHRQSAVRQFGVNNEMNYSTKAGSFLLKTLNRPYDAFSRRAFYKDGRFRETTFIVEAFTRSACYRRGTAQCATCHSPHLPDFSHNLTSLKFRDNPDQMCLQCHNEYRDRIVKHTHHAAGSEASRCVVCHMPQIVNALLFQARSHQIEIPRADLTARFGQAESPNACLLCHKGKDAPWAEQQLQKW